MPSKTPDTTNIAHETDAAKKTRLYEALDDLEKLLNSLPSERSDRALDSLMDVRYALGSVFQTLTAKKLGGKKTH